VIDPSAHIGAVRLRVRDLAQAREFYERVVGLHELERDGSTVRMGPAGGPPLIDLIGDPDAPARPARSTGLFHLALLVPTRRDLGVALRRLVDAGWGLTGASDHLVSEALYLRDPEYNGIEIYRDRPREDWPRIDGTIQMDTLPLDLQAIADEAGSQANGGMADGTSVGHVHLEVADVPPAESFYNGLLGLDVTVRTYPGALFLSAGGYHHHVGVNTWNSLGAPAPPPGSAGLDSFELVVSPADAERLAANAVEERDGAPLLRDPSGNAVLLRAG
jgi:catechol 2,3-dioxygenase